MNRAAFLLFDLLQASSLFRKRSILLRVSQILKRQTALQVIKRILRPTSPQVSGDDIHICIDRSIQQATYVGFRLKKYDNIPQEDVSLSLIEFLGVSSESQDGCKQRQSPMDNG